MAPTSSPGLALSVPAPLVLMAQREASPIPRRQRASPVDLFLVTVLIGYAFSALSFLVRVIG